MSTITLESIEAKQTEPLPQGYSIEVGESANKPPFTLTTSAGRRLAYWSLESARADAFRFASEVAQAQQPSTFYERNAEFREKNWQIRFDAAVEARRSAQEQLYAERERHVAVAQALKQELSRATPTAQAQQSPYAWAVSGISKMFFGPHAEYDARLEANHCGGTAVAFPLFREAQAQQSEPLPQRFTMADIKRLSAELADVPPLRTLEQVVAQAHQAGEVVSLSARIKELIAEHGTLRAVSRSLGIDVGYLSRLEHGDKVSPSPEVLAKLGMRDAGTLYERLTSSPTPPAQQGGQ